MKNNIILRFGMTLIIGFAGGYLCSNLVNNDKLAFFDKFSDFAKVENFLDKKGKIRYNYFRALVFYYKKSVTVGSPLGSCFCFSQLFLFCKKIRGDLDVN